MASKTGTLIRPGPILAIAAVVGIAAGMFLSRQRDLDEHMALEHMSKVVEDLPPTRFPQPPEGPKKPGRTLNTRAVEGLPPYPGASPANMMSQPEGTGG